MKEKITLEEAVQGIRPLDEAAIQGATQRQKELLKPWGSMGKLEQISIQMAGITGKICNQMDQKISFMFGADNGIHEEGVAAGEQELTNMLISGYARNCGSAMNILCQHHNVELKLIDIGIIGELDHSNIDNRRLMEGTNNFAKGLSMPREIAREAIEVGIDYVTWAKEQGYDILGTGEIGIGNTTTAAACIISALGLQGEQAASAIGYGAGLTPEGYAHKQKVILDAIQMHKPDPTDAVDILSKVGGLDIAGLTGVYLGAAYHRIPVVLDGVITIAAALLASLFDKTVVDYMFPSHLSEEPGYKKAAERLGLEPYLNLSMRIGEGCGCPLAMGIIDSALVSMNEITHFTDISPDSDYRIEI